MKLARMLQILRQMVALPGRASRTEKVRMGGFWTEFRRFLAIEELEYRRVQDSGSLVVTVEAGTGPGILFQRAGKGKVQGVRIGTNLSGLLATPKQGILLREP